MDAARLRRLPILREEPCEGVGAGAASGALPGEASGRGRAAERPSSAQPVSRDAARSRRKREVRARTLSVKRMTKRELALGRLLYPPDEDIDPRPRARAACENGGPNAMRPCPYVSCAHHLYLDVSPKTGAIKLNFPDLEVWEMNETCELDVADRGGETHEDVGTILNLTRERVRQMEVQAKAKILAIARRNPRLRATIVELLGLRGVADVDTGAR